MKLFRHGPAGAEKPGLIDAAGVLRDLTGQHAVFTTYWPQAHADRFGLA